MRTHELARKLLELPDGEVFIDAYETRCNIATNAIAVSMRKMKRKTEYSGLYTCDEYDLDPDFEESLEPGSTPGVYIGGDRCLP